MRMESATRRALVVAELALGALRAVERELRRLVVGQVGRPALLRERPPEPFTLCTLRDELDDAPSTHDAHYLAGWIAPKPLPPRLEIAVALQRRGRSARRPARSMGKSRQFVS